MQKTKYTHLEKSFYLVLLEMHLLTPDYSTNCLRQTLIMSKQSDTNFTRGHVNILVSVCKNKSTA